MKHRGTKILSLLLSLVLVLGLMPGMSAWAYSPYGLSVGGVDVDQNLSGEGWSYAPATNTLTLNGATIAVAGGNGIYSFRETLNIVLSNNSTNTVSSLNNTGINCQGKLSISGGGSLTVSGSGGSSGIFCRGLEISGSSVDASGASRGIRSSGTITISGGTVTATSTNGEGISSEDTITISGGSVDASGASRGIRSSGTITISGGTVTATSTNNGEGIYSDETITISNGSVTADGMRGLRGTTTVTISGGSVTATGSQTAIFGNVKNSIAGTGWSDKAGTEGETAIAASEAGQSLGNYKKVVFKPAGYTVTLSGGANAATSGGATTQSVTPGQAMTTVTYTANNGYTFPAFSNSTTNGVTLTRASDTVVTVSGTPTANVNITVPDAAAIPTYTVTYKVINGTWSDGSTADKTETVASGAKSANVPTGMKPASGYTGGAWDKNPADATITEATTFTYTFGAIPTYTVTVNPGPNGSATADKTTAKAGDTITLTVTPDNGYEVLAVAASDADNNQITVTNNSFTMPAADVIVTVQFKEKTTPQPTQPTQPTPTPQPTQTTYIVSFFANGGGGVMNPVTVPANSSYTLPACSFTPPAGKQFKAWQLGSTEFAPGSAIIVDSNAEFVALWKDDENSIEPVRGDIVFIGGFTGEDEWSGYVAPQRAWKVSLAPMVNGSAALGIMTGESTTTDMNVYPTTTIYVFPNADPGYVLDKIIWSLIDGSASYDITEAKNFVMPAMDAVVYVTFKPAG